MLNYAQSLKDSLQEETNAGSKYTALAKEAPNEEAKKKLLEMAKQEIMHKATLECLLLDVNNDSNAVK